MRVLLFSLLLPILLSFIFLIWSSQSLLPQLAITSPLSLPALPALATPFVISLLCYFIKRYVMVEMQVDEEDVNEEDVDKENGDEQSADEDDVNEEDVDIEDVDKENGDEQSVVNDEEDVEKEIDDEQSVVKDEVEADAVTKKADVVFREIGKIHVSKKEIGRGSNGTVVFEGNYAGRDVAVKRLVSAYCHLAKREINHLIASDHHCNIVRFHAVEETEDFVYIALERCMCTLSDLLLVYHQRGYQWKDNSSMRFIKDQIQSIEEALPLYRPSDYPSRLIIKLMRDIVAGLAYLHDLRIVHRDLKPGNVLISAQEKLRAKLSDMGVSKRLVGDKSSLSSSSFGSGSSGWRAPELLAGAQGRQTRAMDLFNLGCILFYCMTAGEHPFGNDLERDMNIKENKVDLFLLQKVPEAQHLVSQLLSPEPHLRPKATDVLHHPLFWNSARRLSFIREASDRLEFEDRAIGSDLLTAIENIAPAADYKRWDKKMHLVFLRDIRLGARQYSFDSVQDLLRLMRNKLNHYRELPLAVQQIVGSMPDEFDHYFRSRFPQLFLEVYKVMYNHCKEDTHLKGFFESIDE